MKRNYEIIDYIDSLLYLEAIHKRRGQLRGGRGKNWSELPTNSTKKLPTWGRGYQKCGKIANVVYG